MLVSSWILLCLSVCILFYAVLSSGGRRVSLVALYLIQMMSYLFVILQLHLGNLRLSERPLFPGVYLIIVKNYKTIIVANISLNPAHPIAVAQAKPQPKDQMRVVLPFELTAIYRHKCASLT